MATTQYIGARYVPLFAEPIEWDKTKQYEPLTIVTHEGNSYTSRQFVPTGIEITNETFWALTGNYNAQIEQYRKEVAEYDGRITTAQVTADSAKTNASAAKTSADAATAAVAAEKTRAETKEADIQSLAETNETDIAQLDAQMAATTVSGLLNKITEETTRAKNAESKLSTDVDSIKCYKNVLNFGVNPNSDDNADAFQTALNTCAENGWILYIPNGTYKMSHSISLPWFCNIEGQSSAGTILKFSSNAGLVGDLTDKNGYKTVVGCVLKNFTISGSYNGFHTRIWNQPWYNNKDDHAYMALNYAGLGGWFTMCNIQNIAIDHFVCGLETFQPNFNGIDYNVKYNDVYGDLRIFRAIGVSFTNAGIRLMSGDTTLNDFDVCHCYEMEPVSLFDCAATNGHTWACDHGWNVYSKSRIVNMEVESQECFHCNQADESETQFDGMLIIHANSDTGGIRIINPTFWNIWNLPNKGTAHNVIRCDDDTTQTVQIYGATFGRNPNLDSTLGASVYPYQLFRTSMNPAAPKAVLFGSICEQFTSINDVRSDGTIYTGTAPLIINITAHQGNWPKGVSTFTGAKTLSYTSV